jgi:hypothetical protein
VPTGRPTPQGCQTRPCVTQRPRQNPVGVVLGQRLGPTQTLKFFQKDLAVDQYPRRQLESARELPAPRELTRQAFTDSEQARRLGQ